uniref:C2H2-type domain-containing protein n=1 Tax=Steinernema glaseri TaxID=37863 RepID=A0A1I7ZKG2_9BILA
MAPRPGLSDGRQCPVCAIFFYGNGVLERHMKAAHSQDYEVWEREHNRPNNVEPAPEEPVQPMEEGEEALPEFADADEPPPTLTAEQPSEQPMNTAEPEDEHMEAEPLGVMVQNRNRPSGRRPTHHIVNEHGIPIAEISDISDVQQLIDSGQLQVQDGDQIILMENNDMDDFEGEGEEHYYDSEDPAARASGSYQEDSRNAVYVNSAGNLQQVDESGLEVATILTEMKEDPSGHPEDMVYLAQEDGTIITDEFGNPVVESYRNAKKTNIVINR